MTQISAPALPTPKPWIAAIAPYVPGKSSADGAAVVAKLSANENPLGTSAAAWAAFAGAQASDDALARYPDPGAAVLRAAIAARHGLDADRVICGTGSDELLHLAASAYAGPGDEIIHVRYGFAVYDIATRRVGATPVVAADRGYATDVDAILAAVTPRTRAVYVANPNNPTGTLASRADIARLHTGLRGDILLVLDQAYAEYLGPDQDDGGLELARTAANVLVTRTFSKIHGLAAERIGWGTAAPAIIDALHRVRAPFNVTHAGQAAAIAAIGDDDFVDRSRDHNRHWRGWLAAELAGMANRGVTVVPSAANFLMVLFAGPVDAATVYRALLADGYIVRHLPGQGLGHALRITIGTEAETRGVAAAIRRHVAAA